MEIFIIIRNELVAHRIMANNIVQAVDMAEELYSGFESVNPVEDEDRGE